MEFTMQDVLHQLQRELPAEEAFSVYEWYCSTYRVSASSIAPASIRYEVFGE
jgi:hypothetical protein